MAYNHYVPTKVDLTPKRHHGFQFVLFLLGWLLPPLGECLRAVLLEPEAVLWPHSCLGG